MQYAINFLFCKDLSKKINTYNNCQFEKKLKYLPTYYDKYDLYLAMKD